MEITLSEPNEQALRLFLTGELTDLDLIACRVEVTRSEVARWKKEQRWTWLRWKMRCRTVVLFVRKLAGYGR